MRVTENSNFNTVRESIGRSKERMSNLQGQYATLKKVNAPSDDPVGSAKILENRTEKVNNEQYQINAKLAQAYLNNSEHALTELADIVVRAKEIALGQANGYGSNEDTRLGIAEEVNQLYQQSVSIANKRVGDRYLFGGYKTNKPPVDQEGVYKGDDGQMMVEIARDVYIAMNITGHEAFNTRPEAAPTRTYGPDLKQRVPASDDFNGVPVPENINLFDELSRLKIALISGDQDALRSTLERFDQLHGRLVAMRAKVGSRVQGIENAINTLERQNITHAELSSSIEDADMAQVVSDLAKEETIFRSALASSHKLIQPTLLDYLK